MIYRADRNSVWGLDRSWGNLRDELPSLIQYLQPLIVDLYLCFPRRQKIVIFQFWFYILKLTINLCVILVRYNINNYKTENDDSTSIYYATMLE